MTLLLVRIVLCCVLLCLIGPNPLKISNSTSMMWIVLLNAPRGLVVFDDVPASSSFILIESVKYNQKVLPLGSWTQKGRPSKGTTSLGDHHSIHREQQKGRLSQASCSTVAHQKFSHPQCWKYGCTVSLTASESNASMYKK